MGKYDVKSEESLNPGQQLFNESVVGKTVRISPLKKKKKHKKIIHSVSSNVWIL